MPTPIVSDRFSPTIFRHAISAVLLGCFITVSGQDNGELAMRARIHLYETWNFDSVAYYHKKVIGKKHTPAFAYSDYGWFLMLKGKHDEALEMIKKAAQMDRADKQLATWYAWALLWYGKQSEARQEIRRALDIAPKYGEALFVASLIASEDEDHAAAIQYAKAGAAADKNWRGGIPLAFAQAGRNGDAIEIAVRYSRDETQFDLMPLAETYAILGAYDRALEYLQKAYEQKHPFFPWVEFWPETRALQADPRFKSILDRLNLKN